MQETFAGLGTRNDIPRAIAPGFVIVLSGVKIRQVVEADIDESRWRH